MTEPVHIAKKTHALLSEAHPHHDDANLARAFEVASQRFDPEPQSDLQLAVLKAIHKLQKAITDGGSAAEVEALLLDAVRAAEQWVRLTP
jgi:hypothetical protein